LGKRKEKFRRGWWCLRMGEDVVWGVEGEEEKEQEGYRC
jgi:hypothetical protein